LLLLLLSACGFFFASAGSCTRNDFEAFKTKYGKTYATEAEEASRFAIFCASMARVAAKNKDAAKQKTIFGITKFSDLTQIEFEKIYLGYRKNKNTGDKNERHAKIDQSEVDPTSFDWRNKSGILTPVYDQGQCGSCWAFSAVENIESQWALAGHGLLSLSPQQVVDCDTSDAGCNGGDTPTAYDYVKGTGGLELWSEYPYTASDGQCQFKISEVRANITGWQYIGKGDEDQMKTGLVSNGPISICLAASRWSDYSGGIMTAKQCGRQIDHCVLLVGYNVANSPPYWIVRNSWGTDWGVENGFIYLEYGTNTCELASEPTSATV